MRWFPVLPLTALCLPSGKWDAQLWASKEKSCLVWRCGRSPLLLLHCSGLHSLHCIDVLCVTSGHRAKWCPWLRPGLSLLCWFLLVCLGAWSRMKGAWPCAPQALPASSLSPHLYYTVVSGCCLKPCICWSPRHHQMGTQRWCSWDEVFSSEVPLF